MRSLLGLFAGFVLAIILRESGHQDLGLAALVGSAVWAIVCLEIPISTSVRPSDVEPAWPHEIVRRQEIHNFQHHVHHNYNYSGVSLEAHETSRELPDGSVLRSRQLRRWQYGNKDDSSDDEVS